ncbi:MAG: heavy-metal-associated domain-containing protein [Fimbriimonadaceae bacterium]|nr:heavy-metal-associated domain-containing protein [Fimbriimonadaceae bacterium]
MIARLQVSGMSCQNCVRHVREALLSVPGVASAEVSLEAGSAEIVHEDADIQAMIAALEDEGYPAAQA